MEHVEMTLLMAMLQLNLFRKNWLFLMIRIHAFFLFSFFSTIVALKAALNFSSHQVKWN